MTDIQWTDPSQIGFGRYAALEGPYSCVAEGDSWALLKDHCSFVVRRVPTAHGLEPFAHDVWRLMVPADSPAVSTTTNKLRAWAGEPVWAIACVMCEGTGRTSACAECDGHGDIEVTCDECSHTHYHNCSDCGGDGYAPGNKNECRDCGGSAVTLPTKRDLGEIVGLVVDRCRLGRLLVTLGYDGDVSVWPSTVGALVVAAPHARLALMRVATDHGEGEAFVP